MIDIHDYEFEVSPKKERSDIISPPAAPTMGTISITEISSSSDDDSDSDNDEREPEKTVDEILDDAKTDNSSINETPVKSEVEETIDIPMSDEADGAMSAEDKDDEEERCNESEAEAAKKNPPAPATEESRGPVTTMTATAILESTPEDLKLSGFINP